MQSFTPVEIRILCRVDEVEAGHPADYAGSQNQGRQSELSRLRDPRTGRCHRQGKTEEEVSRVGEAFREGVKEDDSQRDRRKPGGQAIDRRTRAQKSCGADGQQPPGDRFREQEVSRGGPRIFLVDGPVAQAVEEHGCCPGENHAEEDKREDAQGRMTVGRHQQRAQGEREGEDGVREADQAEKTGDDVRRG